MKFNFEVSHLSVLELYIVNRHYLVLKTRITRLSMAGCKDEIIVGRLTCV